MAETRKIKIDVESNADEAAKDFKKVADNIDDSTDSVKRLNKEVKKTDDAADGASKGFKKISSAAKGLGLALKGAGIGLIIGALAGLKSAFESSGETASGFQKIMETLSILFNQTIGALVNAAKAAYESTGGFNALGKVMGGLLNIALTPLKLAFYGIKLGVQELQLAWEKSFLGDKDPKTIKELRKNIKATQKDIDQVGKDFIKSGKDIAENFVEAATEVVDFGGKAIQNLSKISVTAAYEQASALVDARNNAAVAAAQQGRLVEIYDRQAETLRQIRDEERNSIPERIAANNKLKDVLDQQEKAMLAQAGLQIQAAQMEYNKSKTVENQVALTEALANKEGVLAQIQGLRSEQLANDLALQREADELVKARTESEVTLSIERQKAEAEFIKEEDRKIQKLIDISKQERELQLARLQEQIDIHKEGTQARLDAEIAYNEQKQALDIQQAQLEEQLRKEQERKDDEMLKKDLEDIKAVNEQKVALAQDSLALISSITELFGQRNERQAKAAFNIDKAAKIASSTIATIEGTIEAWKTAQKSPITAVMPAYPAIQASLTAAFGAAGIAKIAAAKFGGSGGGESSLNSPSGSGGGVMSPSFNVVGNSGMNQLAQIQQQPIQAYVVSGEVTSAQALDRNRIKNATL
jgi:hypothetical protein